LVLVTHVRRSLELVPKAEGAQTRDFSGLVAKLGGSFDRKTAQIDDYDDFGGSFFKRPAF
jgi:hypothetical protein